MWFDGAKQSRIPSHLFATACFSLGVRRPGAWSHLQMIVGACDCPKPHALTTSSQRLLFVALLFCDEKKASLTAQSHHIFRSTIFWQYTPLQFRIPCGACLSRDWRAFDTTFLPGVFTTYTIIIYSTTYTTTYT